VETDVGKLRLTAENYLAADGLCQDSPGLTQAWAVINTNDQTFFRLEQLANDFTDGEFRSGL
jgi:hypothetical protein